MVLLSTMAVLDATQYWVRVYSGVGDSRLYPQLDDLHGGGAGRLSRVSPTLLRFIKRFGVQMAVCGSCYPAEYAETVFRRKESNI